MLQRLIPATAALVVCFHATAAELRWADPRGFFEKETVVETKLRPGLRQISAKGMRDGRPIESQMLVVDLHQSDLRLEALTGSHTVVAKSGQFVWRSTVSQMLTESNALGAINVSFFDIASTQATHGLVMRNGNLLREPQANRSSLLVFDGGQLAIAEPTWSGKVRAGAQSRPLAGMNRPQLAADEVVAYQLPWSRSPGTTAAFSRTQKNVREILIGPVTFHAASAAGEPSRLGGKVLEIRDDGRSIDIGKDQLVLTAGESAAPFFRNARVGDVVSIEWSLADLPGGHKFSELRQAVSAQPVLIQDGKRIAGEGAFHTVRHPRSAIGLHPDGRQAILLVVDGRSQRSAGMSLGTLGEYLEHLGSHQALNFDGGGSSAIVSRVRRKPNVLNVPSDHRERLVPTGLGVMKAK